MAKEADYRQNASDALQMAQRAATNRDERRLLKMAEAWLNLADRARRMVKNAASVGPLIRQKINRHLDE